jgi:integrase
VKYPLRSATKNYLAMREERVKKSTLDNESRILWHLVDELEGMVQRGELSTNSPWKMGRKEIRAILDHLRDGDRALENETLEKYIRYIEGLLTFCGNRIIEKMKKDSPNLFPKRGRKPITHLTEDEVEAIQEAADTFEGWNGAIMRFIAAIYPATGLRPSELRKARLEDLDRANMTIKVRHPKGESSYGDKRVVAIMPQAEDASLRFLKERHEYIQSMGLKASKYLIPNLSTGEDAIYSSNHFRKLKKRLQDETGIEFKLKDYRSTFASLTIQKDSSLMPEVSQQLGHSSLVTTQRFYADMDLIDAGSKLRKAWSKKAVSQTTQIENDSPRVAEAELESKRSGNSIKPLIGDREYLPGYG